MEKIKLVPFNEFTSFASKAFLWSHGTEYTGEALYVALLLHASGKGGRTAKNEREIASMLDDPNLLTPGHK